MTKEQALHNFWSSFRLKAYDESTVPDTTLVNGTETPLKPPYITYSVSFAYLDETAYLTASVWDKSTSWLLVTDTAEKIGREIGYFGKTLPYDGGYIRLHRGTPFMQRMADEDDTIRRIYLNVTAENLAV